MKIFVCQTIFDQGVVSLISYDVVGLSISCINSVNGVISSSNLIKMNFQYSQSETCEYNIRLSIVLSLDISNSSTVADVELGD
jgi:hypothetical protein